MTDELVFYTNPMSRGRIIRWMLEETGADYETRVLGYADSMKGAEYLTINPMGKVPAIVHKGRVVTECAAICAYLADAFPDAGLAPTEEERADYYRWLFFAAGPLEQAVTNHNAKFEPSAEQGRSFGYGDYDRAIATFEKAVAAHPYIAGDRFTAADVYVGSQVMWGMQFGWMPDRAAFQDYAGRLAERDAYRRGNEKDDALMPQQAPAA
ncbi:glutathione S-transferase family protein [Stakelama tenebrarum]|uniref:Glutathione S-transferase family protein n=1 Tax=Stakelama tenebrarum TaxID=2711215 RepID=A0A6G6Y958_9SPHN|nr:glutathione S-transferase family protein [Sphingosinithalassobacter tenebrarum]QIG81113.1 glutathione S-transferase family protein [Sphingosinithalassobacter tenebrarum]